MVTGSLAIEDALWKAFNDRCEPDAVSELTRYIMQRVYDDSSQFLEIALKGELVKRWNLNHPEKFKTFYDLDRDLYIHDNEEWLYLPRKYFPDTYREYKFKYRCHNLKLFVRLK